MSRRFVFAWIIAGGLALLAASAPAGTLTTDLTLEHDGLTRYFDVYEPDDLPSAPVPLLLALHGGTQSNDNMQLGATQVYRLLADEHGFIVLYPNGTSSTTGLSGPSGSFNWNDCRADAGPGNTTADDVGFLNALVDWALASYDIDAQRIYASGASNGGLMAYRLAFELSDRIAATGHLIANLPADSECPAAPASPISTLVMNGTADPFMPFAGGEIPGGRGPVLSASETRDFWRGFLGTADAAHPIDFPDSNPDDDSTVAALAYCQGDEGSAHAFYTVTGGGHTRPSVMFYIGAQNEAILGPQNRDIEGLEHVWRFLSSHRLSGSAPVCGNLCVDPGEACDDGNVEDGDACPSDCGVASPPVPTPSAPGFALLTALLVGSGVAALARRRGAGPAR